MAKAGFSKWPQDKVVRESGDSGWGQRWARRSWSWAGFSIAEMGRQETEKAFQKREHHEKCGEMSEVLTAYRLRPAHRKLYIKAGKWILALTFMKQRKDQKALATISNIQAFKTLLKITETDLKKKKKRNGRDKVGKKRNTTYIKIIKKLRTFTSKSTRSSWSDVLEEQIRYSISGASSFLQAPWGNSYRFYGAYHMHCPECY